ncbi:MAG: lamin tail domain-containing protein [Bacteroidia bacterium]|nr:lamin tail domain-containing protein [Bacteroidia bacterium]MCZ2277618.1 lamin tail domain-containing protein [Bacteroidia bacterium]
MRLLFLLSLLLINPGVYAQLTDTFSDGDFTNNPAWSGDTGNFIINASYQLQLNALAAGISYLSTSGNSTSLDNSEWQFFIRLNFPPSNNNYARVYLVSDQSNLKGSLNGYYLQFGETGSNDAIELFRQSGYSSVSVARGTDGFIASSFAIRVKVTRDASGVWSIYCDATAGNNFTLQASGSDLTFSSSQWFGVLCNYTSGNTMNFFFDDFKWPYSADTTAPSVLSVTAISATQAEVTFDEAVELSSAQNVINYYADNGLGNPVTATRDTFDFSLIRLVFNSSFQNSVTNVLTVSDISDLNGNTMLTSAQYPFVYTIPIQAQRGDIVFSEIMADPDPPVQLPAFEYLELFNRSASDINLMNWTLTAGTTKTFGNLLLPAGEYLIICTPQAEVALSVFGAVAALFTSSTTLTNSGTTLILKDNTGLTIDSLIYSDGWYRNSQKKDGGWSLERINPDFICPNPLNWAASVDFRGGTPGAINSINGNYDDSEPPSLVRAYLTAPDKVVAIFSEPLNKSDLLNLSNYTIDHGQGNPLSASLISDSEVELSLLTAVLPSVIYTLTVSQNISDCPGNLISKNTARFAIDDVADVSDILINEVLYRPSDTGAEFIEIYNRSSKIIDLSKLRLAKVNPDNSLQTYYLISAISYLIFPEEYFVLTKDPEAVKRNYLTLHPENFLTMSSFPGLTDSGDEFTLISTSGIRIDQLRYSPKWQFALLNDDKGISLERISFNRPTQDSTNWHSASESVGFATPAYKNSQHTDLIKSDGELIVSPEIFSPDNDGFNDIVSFSYIFDSPGYVANLKIFDARGREMIHLIKNQLLGIEGTFSWDGITTDRQKAPVGIYIAWFEVFNSSGTVKKFKKQFVLASKM